MIASKDRLWWLEHSKEALESVQVWTNLAAQATDDAWKDTCLKAAERDRQAAEHFKENARRNLKSCFQEYMSRLRGEKCEHCHAKND